MKLLVKKTLALQGSAEAPGSKSQSVRALLMSLLAKGVSNLSNIPASDDIDAAKDVCKALQVDIHEAATHITIKSQGAPLQSAAVEIHTGNSGITTLFTLPLLGLRTNFAMPIKVMCGAQMQARPIKPLLDALNKLGMQVESLEHDGQLPISISGQLKGGAIEMDGFNSQYISALLMSLPCAEGNSQIRVRNLHERPYVNMTLEFLKQHGITVHHLQIDEFDHFQIPGRQAYQPLDRIINGDYSSASCLIAGAVLLQSTVELQGLRETDAQGDKKLISILQDMGANIIVEADRVRISGKQTLNGIRIDANEIPDLLPALAVIGTQALGKTEIYNVKQARIKETDRISSMTEGLRKMGAHIEEHEDGMTIYHSKLQGATVMGFNDHRTVMALSIAGLIADGNTEISEGLAINKTYPQFVKTMQSLGANLHFDKPISHIILIGFKHVGKTHIGKKLAKALKKPFVDIDSEIEKQYHLNSRDLIQSLGEEKFRAIETAMLNQVLQNTASVISLGGGTILNPANQEKIKSHRVIHVEAAKGIVFERIMVAGLPAFFDPQEEPYESFKRIWDERTPIYQKLASLTINNNGSIDEAVQQALLVIKG